jgi:hypothetical protein
MLPGAPCRVHPAPCLTRFATPFAGFITSSPSTNLSHSLLAAQAAHTPTGMNHTVKSKVRKHWSAGDSERCLLCTSSCSGAPPSRPSLSSIRCPSTPTSSSTSARSPPHRHSRVFVSSPSIVDASPEIYHTTPHLHAFQFSFSTLLLSLPALASTILYASNPLPCVSLYSPSSSRTDHIFDQARSSQRKYCEPSFSVPLSF